MLCHITDIYKYRYGSVLNYLCSHKLFSVDCACLTVAHNFIQSYDLKSVNIFMSGQLVGNSN